MHALNGNLDVVGITPCSFVIRELSTCHGGGSMLHYLTLANLIEGPSQKTL